MSKEIHFQVVDQLLQAAEEQTNYWSAKSIKAKEVIAEAIHFNGAIDPNGEPIISENRVEQSHRTIAFAEKLIDSLDAFRGDFPIHITSSELHARLDVSEDLRAWLLKGLIKFFVSSRITEQFIAEQQWRVDNWLSADNNFFCYKAYQLLRNQDQPKQPEASAVDQEAKKPDGTPPAPTIPHGFPRKGVPQQVEFVLKNILPNEEQEIMKLVRTTVSGVSTLYYNGQPFRQKKYVEGELFDKAVKYVGYEFTTRINFYSHFRKLKLGLIEEQND